MAAAEHPTVPVQITLDKTRTLRFSLRAVRRIMSEKGQDYFEDTGDHDNLERLSYLAWQGLLHEDPELTHEQVEDLIDFSQIGELAAAINRALGQDGISAPAQGEGDGGERPTKARRGRSRPS
jgi:hypothetical protein